MSAMSSRMKLQRDTSLTAESKSGTSSLPNQENAPRPSSDLKKAGLEGVIAATTALSRSDGEAGRLVYRGYDIHDLARHTTFEEIAHLLWFGHLPTRHELTSLQKQLATERTIPDYVLALLRDLAQIGRHTTRAVEPMDALRTALSAWGASAIAGKPTIDQALAITARLSLFLAAFHRLRHKLEPIEPRPDLDYAANFLYLLTGELPEERHQQALNAYLVLHADHGMNASTFTARIVASTEADMASAVVAALGALKGPLHGGAPLRVLEMLDAIGTLENVEPWLRQAVARGERLMGFGHRIYKTEDPRASELREIARTLDPDRFALAHRVEEGVISLLKEQKPGRNLYTNVEFYPVVLLSSMGFPGDLFSPTFAISRIAGWTAHILEQARNNRLIRPEAEYTGPTSLSFVPLDEREPLLYDVNIQER